MKKTALANVQPRQNLALPLGLRNLLGSTQAVMRRCKGRVTAIWANAGFITSCGT